MDHLRLLDIAIVVQQIERAITLGLEITPLALELLYQVFLVLVVHRPGVIRPAGHQPLRQQMSIFIHRYSQV